MGLAAVLENSAWRVDRVEVDRVEREKEDPEVGSEEAVWNHQAPVLLSTIYSLPSNLYSPKANRGDWIRTSDLCVPNAALYQAEPHPVDNFKCNDLANVRIGGYRQTPPGGVYNGRDASLLF
jgi:hypothetical protein